MTPSTTPSYLKDSMKHQKEEEVFIKARPARPLNPLRPLCQRGNGGIWCTEGEREYVSTTKGQERNSRTFLTFPFTMVLLTWWLLAPPWILGFTDRIVAVVNKDVITWSNLQLEVRDEHRRLKAKYRGKELERRYTQNRLLLLSPFSDKQRRATAHTSLYRNQFVAALADRVVVPYAAPSSKTFELCLSAKPCPRFRR